MLPGLLPALLRFRLPSPQGSPRITHIICRSAGKCQKCPLEYSQHTHTHSKTRMPSRICPICLQRCCILGLGASRDVLAVPPLHSHYRRLTVLLRLALRCLIHTGASLIKCILSSWSTLSLTSRTHQQWVSGQTARGGENLAQG